ncbi:MAG: B12-binding domain-containing radical SAM protein [Candidatus Scalinduaceae bacterium]
MKNNTRIILLEHPRHINPKKLQDVVNTPLSSCLMTDYIASVLKSKNLDVEIVDANLYEWSFHKTVQELKEKSFNVLGVHLVYLWEDTEDIFKMLLNIRRNCVNVHTNLYGHFPTFAFREILSKYPFVDSITVGEPEITFLKLAKAVINKKDTSTLYTIDGLAFKTSHSNTNLPLSAFVKSSMHPPFTKGGEGGLKGICSRVLEGEIEKYSLEKHGILNSKIEEDVLKTDVIQNKPRKPISKLDELPFPYRHDFKLLKQKGIATYILASRGCYGECTFCYLDQFYGETSYWRGRSPENIVDELYYLCEDYGERYFYFADANFFGPGKKGKERACEIARLIKGKDLKINFGIECRVNDIEDASIGKLVEAGLNDVFLGIESGNNSSLNRFKKFTTVEDNKKAINILRKYGIEPNYGFIMFEPYSTLEDVRGNYEFLKEMKMLRVPSVTAHLLHHRQTIFKGTPDYQKRKSLAKSVSRLNYEYICNFKDERVADFAESIRSFCLEVLEGLSKDRDFKREQNSCFYDEDDSLSKNINEKLIEHFERALSSFENKEDNRLLFAGKGAKDAKNSERFI